MDLTGNVYRKQVSILKKLFILFMILILISACSETEDTMFISRDMYKYEKFDSNEAETWALLEMETSEDKAIMIGNIILSHEINNDGENYKDYGLNVYEYKNCYVFEKYKKEKDEDSQEEPKTYSVIITKYEMEAYK